MSIKYQRVKEGDRALPAPLRMLTRAFSSITLAVVLLTLISLYGLLASVPLAMLVRGVGYLLIFAGTVLPVVWVCVRWLRGRLSAGRVLGAALGAGVSVFIALAASVEFYQWTTTHSFFHVFTAGVIYRKPWLEMTELQFYSWWPMKLLLVLFVCNMVWATIRRIEFRFENLGVLTVHTGIVTLGVGSLIYGNAKLEGDAILWRTDLGGVSVSHFYDVVEPALFLELGGTTVMVPLQRLPRYNDYLDRDLPRPVELHKHPTVASLLGPGTKLTLRRFMSYGELVPTWEDAPPGQRASLGPMNPGLVVSLGTRDIAHDRPLATLLAEVPSRRVIEQPGLGIEYLRQPSPQRIADLQEPFEGDHAILLSVPDANFRQVVPVRPQQTMSFDLGDDTLRVEVESIGPYDLPFVTPGYVGATDTRVQLRVEFRGRTFRRIVMHRYPERSQEFVPDASAGPMGQRVDPSPELEVVYLDRSKPWFRLIEDDDTAPLLLLARLPGESGHNAIVGRLDEDRLPLGRIDGEEVWLHLTGRPRWAVESSEPVPTPKTARQPKDEGTYVNAALALDVEHTSDQGSWSRRYWLRHMRYPDFADEQHKPARIVLPQGVLEVAFSRTRHELPFEMRLASFEMIPYPGSDVAKDYRSDLIVTDVDPATGQALTSPFTASTRLNNPLLHHGYKISQTGWDPGDPQDPNQHARDERGRYLNQQRFSIVGVGNNQGIRLVALGSILIVAGIPWAFYVKPWLVRRKLAAK